MIQDIAPHTYHNEYKPTAPAADSYVLYYRDKEVLVGWEGEQLTFPTFAQLEKTNPDIYSQCRYLFAIDDRKFYLATELNLPVDLNFEMNNIFLFRSAQPSYMAFAGITGSQLFRWYQDRTYCGRCRTEMVHSDKERMVYCPSCGKMEYPKLSPAVIVAVTDHNRLLLSKYAGRNYTNYALIAGYTEIGETIEETVKREVMEEVGLRVKNIRYYKSQPWSFSDSVLMGFFADLDGDADVTLDTEELAMAEWFEREEIPVKPAGVSLTNEMIIKFKNHEV